MIEIFINSVFNDPLVSENTNGTRCTVAYAILSKTHEDETDRESKK